MKYLQNNLNFTIKYISIITLIIIFFKLNNFQIGIKKNHSKLKIALCTMGKKENLYSKEFIDYYIKLGINHIFIYDHNEPNTEKIIDTVENKYKDKVSVFNVSTKNITNQAGSFTDCYQKNKYKYDWFLMVDMDEYLFIVNNTLEHYLNLPNFNDCDIINFHWVLATDNNMIHYENKTLFQRFKKPYIKSPFVKSMVRGNITKLRYSVHSPSYSPDRNITCNNEGQKLNYSILEIEDVSPISIKFAYLIHFRFKSTEEFINKYKRGYSNWFGKRIKAFLYSEIKDYFKLNNITNEKINFMEKELNLSLNEFKIKLNDNK